jgi:radical SAM superfamily enzyme YgiQ (UPF0313 family)
MRVLFIYRPASLDVTDPLGVLYLSASLKQAGHEVELLMPNLESRMMSRILEFQPEVIAYSVTSGSERYYLAMDREIKKHLPHVTIFGGPHASFFPEVIEEDGLDAICIGEGDLAIVDFVNRLGRDEDITTTPNFWVKSEGRIVRNEVRPLVADLDALPFPDRQILMKYPGYRRYRTRFFLSSRGCPYKCTYCFDHSMAQLYKGKGKYVRHRSVPNVIAEIQQVRSRYGLRHVYFYDDVFVLDRRWIQEFCEMYRHEVGLPFTGYLRVNLVTEELIRSLARAGCHSVAMAVESGNEPLRTRVLGRKMSNEDILEAARLLRAYKINFMTQNMVALPTETVDDAIETITLNAQCKPSYAWCSIFQPYPRTALAEYCVELGLIPSDYANNPTYQDDAPIKRGREKRDFERLHKLFSFAVEFPFLIPHLKSLIRLPLGFLYQTLYRGFKGYTHLFRLRMSSFDMGFLFYLLAVYRYRWRVRRRGSLHDVAFDPRRGLPRSPDETSNAAKRTREPVGV